MPLYVGLDVGTQSCKALVWSSKSKKVLSRGRRAYDILPTDVAGRAEQHASDWIEAVEGSLDDALSSVDRSDVAALAVSGQQHGLVALDASGHVLRPAKLWCDVEATAQAEALSADFGFQVPPAFTAAKLRWLQETEPAAYEKLRHVLLPHDYINYWLTGELAMEAGDASGTGLFDLEGRQFSPELIRKLDPDIGPMLPPILHHNAPLGPLKAELAERFGLRAGVTVAAGSGDNMMSALGAGCVAAGDVAVSLGTSGTVFATSERPVFDRSGGIAPFCDATGRWLPLLCTMNCTGPPQEVQAASGHDRGALSELGAAEPAGCEGLHMLPYLIGERTPPWPQATGAFLGLRHGMLARPGLLYRAALEGSTFALADGIRLLEGHGVPCERVRLVGGGSQSALWRRIVADVLQLPLTFPTEADSAALGAALQAAAVHHGADVREYVLENEPSTEPAGLEPDTGAADAYGEALARHREAGQALFGSTA